MISATFSHFRIEKSSTRLVLKNRGNILFTKQFDARDGNCLNRTVRVETQVWDYQGTLSLSIPSHTHGKYILCNHLSAFLINFLVIVDTDFLYTTVFGNPMRFIVGAMFCRLNLMFIFVLICCTVYFEKYFIKKVEESANGSQSTFKGLCHDMKFFLFSSH